MQVEIFSRDLRGVEEKAEAAEGASIGDLDAAIEMCGDCSLARLTERYGVRFDGRKEVSGRSIVLLQHQRKLPEVRPKPAAHFGVRQSARPSHFDSYIRNGIDLSFVAIIHKPNGKAIRQ